MEIKLVDVIPGTDDLVLSGPDTVDPNRWLCAITWVTINPTEIKSFKIKSKHSGENPFKKDIPTKFRTKVRLRLKKRDKPLEWSYAIHWVDKHNKPRIFDPKISIKPNKSHSSGFLLTLLFSIFSLFTLRFLFNKFKK